MSQEFNVIEAKFSSRDRKCVIGPLWQYDYGQILRITGIDLPESYEVHFSNDPRGDAKSIPGNANGVRIPAEYLKSGSSVFAWLYVHQGEDDGSTEYQIEIQVRRRARPTSEAPDSEEKTAIGDLIEQMNVALSGAKEERAKAETAAENAEKAAQNVDTSVKLAQSYAVGGTGVREGEDQDNAKFWYERTAAAHNENIVDMEAKKDELVGELEQAAQRDKRGKHACQAVRKPQRTRDARKIRPRDQNGNEIFQRRLNDNPETVWTAVDGGHRVILPKVLSWVHRVYTPFCTVSQA